MGLFDLLVGYVQLLYPFSKRPLICSFNYN